MTPRLYLGIVLHNHQPVGNYGFVIEQVYQQAYAPMLAALERHAGVRVAIHTSGCLFDWMVAEHPEYVTRLRALCDRGQIEMLTGGYYEPILPMITDADKAGQIAKLTGFIERGFAQRPTGLWLTERVWEPGLPAPLAGAGVEWTLVDDAHFRQVGVREDDLDGYYLTEDQGKRVRLFAGSQRLRYTIPWLNVEDVIIELRDLAETKASAARGAPYIVLGDDGEKFGAWPTTYAHVWEQGWMEKFFTAVEAESDWLTTITPGAYASEFPARGLTYLPAASYAEMMEWAMPAAAAAEYRRVSEEIERDGRGDVQQYLRGGFWRSFLAKYPEANAMHKRGLRIASKLVDVDAPEAREALWAAQCNCPYWHGVFGGLYLRHIRRATNTNLVKAERLADDVSLAAAQSPLRVERADFDYDGHDEILVQSRDISVMVHPALGGMVSEFDLRRRDTALLDVLTRRREAYHQALIDGATEASTGEPTNIHGAVRAKEAGLGHSLTFDLYRRAGMQEWVLPGGTAVHEFAVGDFDASWEPAGAWDASTRASQDAATIDFERTNGCWRLAKSIAVPVAGELLTASYALTNVSGDRAEGLFVSEWNIAPPQAPEGDDRIALIEVDGEVIDLVGSAGAIKGVRQFTIKGSAVLGLKCVASAELDVWHFPVDSVSSSEGGIERVLQGFSIGLVMPIELAAGDEMKLDLEWSAHD